MAARTLVRREPQGSTAEHSLPAFVGIVAPVLDAIVIALSGVFSRAAYSQVSELPVDLNTSFALATMLAVIFIMLMRGQGLYEARHILSLERQLRSATALWFLSVCINLAFVFLLKAGHGISRGFLLFQTLSGLAALVSYRLVWRPLLARAVKAGWLRRRTACVFSLIPIASASRQIGDLRLAGIEVVQRVELPSGPARGPAIAEAVASMRDGLTDEIVIVGSAAQLDELDDVVARLRLLPVPVRLLPDAALSALARQPSKRLGRFALIDIKREPLAASELAAKRALDIVVAGTALVITAPLICMAMAAVALDTPGPTLFRQSRRGFNGRTFQILKLRSMTCMEDGAGIVQARRNDPRVTSVGYWLRRTSIDELPQLWNVLRGDMSMVGPRPHAVAHDDHYDPIIDNYVFRQHVKPGLTGWAQVNGHRGETPEVAMMAARVEHDVWYVNNWSVLLDIRILFLTFTRLLGRSAY